MFMGLGQVLNETQESQIILSTLRERLWCSADQRTAGNLEKEYPLLMCIFVLQKGLAIK